MNLYPKMSEKLEAMTKTTGTWIAAEKVHGANLGICVNATEVRAMRRKGFLSPDQLGQFFGLASIWPDLVVRGKQLHDQLGENLIIYGELAGGIYPHLSSRKDQVHVQTGVFYNPELFYMVFDIYLPRLDQWLSPSQTMDRSAQAGFLVPPVIGKGKYNQIMGLSEKFASHVPHVFDLPFMKDNWAEGLVIRPDIATSTENRVIFKKKRANFGHNGRVKPDFNRHLLSAHEAAILDHVAQKLSADRVWSARSKLGHAVSIQELANEVIEDVVLDSVVVDHLSLLDNDYAMLIAHLYATVCTLCETYA